LEYVDCTDYNTDKEIILTSQIYAAASGNASVYNPEQVRMQLSAPTFSATAVLPELFLYAPLTISACSNWIVYEYNSTGTGKCRPTITWALEGNTNAWFIEDTNAYF